MSDKEDIVSDEKKQEQDTTNSEQTTDQKDNTKTTEEGGGIKTTEIKLDEEKFDFFEIPSIHISVSEQRIKELDYLETVFHSPYRNVPVLKVNRKEEALLLLGLYQYHRNNDSNFYTVSADNFEITNDNNYDKDDNIKEGAMVVALKRPDIPVHFGMNDYIENNVLNYFVNHFLQPDMPAVIVVERKHWSMFQEELKIAQSKISGLDNSYEPYDHAGLARSAPLEISPLTKKERALYFQGYLDIYAADNQIILTRPIQKYLINRSENQFKYDNIFLKLFEVLEHCTAEVTKRGENKITQKVVSQVFKKYFPVHNPVKALADMDIRLKKKIFGQDQAIDTSFKTILSHLDNHTRTKPTVLAFFGPSGVGKTALAEEISLAMTGKKVSCINMAEYSDSFKASNLIGSAKGYVNSNEDGLLATIIKENPNAVILLDEFEKADEQVQKLFLGIFDKGNVFDNHSGDIDMTKTTIILTSNAGVKTEKSIGFDQEKQKMIADGEAVNNAFPPELLGRIDAKIFFNPLTDKAMEKITDKFMQQFKPRFDELRVQVTLSPKARQELIEDGQDPRTGARPLMALLRQKVKTPIEIGVLKKKIKPGSRVVITSIKDETMRIFPIASQKKQPIKKKEQHTRD